MPRRTIDDLAADLLSRRDLLRGLALAGASLAVPGALVAQAAAARGRASPQTSPNEPAPLAAPLEAPFAATGWRTVALDHLSYHCTDYEKAAAFYVALLGWTVRADDGERAVLDIGPGAGSVVFRGGLTAPAPAALTDDGIGPGRAPTRAVYDSFAWGIEPWDTARVQAALEARGLAPEADHVGRDYRSFHFRDPDGFSVAVSNATPRRRRPATGAPRLRAAAPFEPTHWKTLFVDHLSFEVADYRRSAAFYEALLGWRPRQGPGGGDDWPDSPQSVTMRIGDVAGAIVRASATASRGGTPVTPTPGAVTATIGHISFGIAPWDTAAVRAALLARDVAYTIDGRRTPREDMADPLASFHVPDAMGWDLQIGNRVHPSRSP